MQQRPPGYKVHRSICMAALGGYGVLVTYWMLLGWGRAPQPGFQYNLLPFASIYQDFQWANGPTKAWAINFLGNIGVFIPLGALIACCWPRRFWKTLLVHSLAVASMEVIQLLTRRGKLDIDDLILNTTGMVIGYVIVHRMGTKRG
jgi:glycopeptide antibiotics resistance protein